MTRAIIMAFHKYTPFGDEFYQPIYDFQIKQLEKYKDEFDKIYLVDSNWNLTYYPHFAKIIKVDPSLRYYDAYKEVLPQIKEDLVLFMDNDMIVYKKGVIKETFDRITPLKSCEVVSIIQTIGTMKVPLQLGNKFAAFYLATYKNLLMNYLDVDWSPDAMPYTETMGLLTEAILKDKHSVFEMIDDHSNIYLGDSGGILEAPSPGKNLGYYHIRAGSTPAMLLATKNYGNIDTYWDYLNNQPRQEYLRQCAWYQYMGGNPEEIIKDCGIVPEFWDNYIKEFTKYHGL